MQFVALNDFKMYSNQCIYVLKVGEITEDSRLSFYNLRFNDNLLHSNYGKEGKSI